MWCKMQDGKEGKCEEEGKCCGVGKREEGNPCNPPALSVFDRQSPCFNYSPRGETGL